MEARYRRFENGQGEVNFRLSEEDPDAIHHFVDVNKTVPSVFMSEGYYSFNQWLDVLKDEFDGLVCWMMEYDDYCQACVQVPLDDQVVFFRTSKTNTQLAAGYELTEEQEGYLGEKGMLAFLDYDVFYSIEHGMPRDIVARLDELKMKEKKKASKINIIVFEQDLGLYTKSMPIESVGGFDLDLHYGDGMTEYHEAQMKRMIDANKGIVLLYGEPGTGKTTYIKRLVKDIENAKQVLYMPNSIIDMLGTPSFNTFLLDFVDDSDKKGILIIVEDGERALLDRKNNPQAADTVSNILNTTDGILNDFLNVQILVTLNADLKLIDSAIMRKKRLLAMRHFGKLSKEDAQKLIDSIGAEHQATDEMTVADVYALLDQKEDSILLQDNSTSKGGMGFNTGR